jgi:hypothetical protein
MDRVMDDWEIMFADYVDDYRRGKLEYWRIDWQYHLTVCDRVSDGFANNRHSNSSSQ